MVCTIDVPLEIPEEGFGIYTTHNDCGPTAHESFTRHVDPFAYTHKPCFANNFAKSDADCSR